MYMCVQIYRNISRLNSVCECAYDQMEQGKTSYEFSDMSVYICIHAYLHTYVYVQEFSDMSVYICIYTYWHTYVYVQIYMYMYTE